MIVWQYPWLFFLLILPLFIRLLKADNTGCGLALKVPFVKELQTFQAKNGKAGETQKSSFLKYLLWLSWLFIVLSLMRPVMISEPIRLKAPARDILLVTDISTSMTEDDFTYNGRYISRLNAVKAVIGDFVKKRNTDRLGLILFATRPYLQVPPTFDRQSVLNVLEMMKAGMAGDSTAIGDALALALKTVKESGDKENKVIILLTDGENNDGKMGLAEVIDLAESEGVKVYTIGISGTDKSFFGAFFGKMRQTFDEKSLKKLAERTNGKYFRADDLKSLFEVYQAIDKAEPQEQNQNFVYVKTELYVWPLALAVLSVILLWVISLIKRSV